MYGWGEKKESRVLAGAEGRSASNCVGRLRSCECGRVEHPSGLAEQVGDMGVWHSGARSGLEVQSEESFAFWWYEGPG